VGKRKRAGKRIDAPLIYSGDRTAGLCIKGNFRKIVRDNRSEKGSSHPASSCKIQEEPGLAGKILRQNARLEWGGECQSKVRTHP